MTTKKRPVVFTNLVLMLIPVAGSADDSMPLFEIMQGLRDDTVQISDGLLTDSFEQIAQATDAIANHPKVSADDAQRVAAELGEEMPTFKALDTLVHDLALQISAAARAQDRAAVLADYQQMFEGCIACHDAYKDRVAAALAQGAESASDQEFQYRLESRGFDHEDTQQE